MVVTIARTAYDKIFEHAGASMAEEVCGVLLGHGLHIEEALPAANIANDRTRHFEIDPTVLLRAHRMARAQGRAVIGHYHSHPNGIARPSPHDAAGAFQPGLLWLIVAAGAIAAYRAVDKGEIAGRFEAMAMETG